MTLWAECVWMERALYTCICPIGAHPVPGSVWYYMHLLPHITFWFCVSVGTDRWNRYMSRAQLSAVPTSTFLNFLCTRPEFRHALLSGLGPRCPLRTSHYASIREQCITSELLVRFVGRYRDVLRIRTFGIYMFPLDLAVIPASRIFVS